MKTDLGHSTFAIQIASTPTKESCVVEIWCGEEMIAALNDENGYPEIEIYPRADGKPWVFNNDQFQEQLKLAGLELDKNPPR